MTLAAFSFRVRENVAYAVTADPADAGTVQRRRTNGATIRAFTLSWPIVGTTEKDAIVADFDAAKGSAGTATLSHPVYGSLTVRFLGDRLDVRRRGPGRWAVGATVEVEL